MRKIFWKISTLLLAVLSLTACSESRKDPCRLLSVAEVQAVDNTVAVAIWAGRDGERKEDEVCVFHTAEGDPRVMLFSWYDPETHPDQMVMEGAELQGGEFVELPGSGSRAVASFKGNELGLLAVQSPLGVVGIRVRKPVDRNSEELMALIQLAETALSRNR